MLNRSCSKCQKQWCYQWRTY